MTTKCRNVLNFICKDKTHQSINKCGHREAAANIIDIFEDKLDELGVDLPAEDREEYESEDHKAHIFGEVYYNLEDEITRYLAKTSKVPIAGTDHFYISKKKRGKR